MKKTPIILLAFLLLPLSSCSNVLSPSDEFELIKGNKYVLKSDSDYSLTFSNDTNVWEISYTYRANNQLCNGARKFALEQIFDQDKIPSESNVNLSHCRAYAIEFDPISFTGNNGVCDRYDFAWFMDHTSNGYKFLFHYDDESLSPTKKKIFLANYCSTVIGLTPNVTSTISGTNALFY